MISLLDTAGNMLLHRNISGLCQCVSGGVLADGCDTSESSLMTFNSLSISPLYSTLTLLSDNTMGVQLPKVPIILMGKTSFTKDKLKKYCCLCFSVASLHPEVEDGIF
jgi:hypothetical protein